MKFKMNKQTIVILACSLVAIGISGLLAAYNEEGESTASSSRHGQAQQVLILKPFSFENPVIVRDNLETFEQLSDEQLTNQEQLVWQELLGGSSKPSETFKQLNMLLESRKDQKFSYQGIKRSDIEMLVRLKPLRLVNCLYENMIELKKRKFNEIITGSPSLTNYIKYYDSRQEKMCWIIYEKLFSKMMQQITSGLKEILAAMQIEVSKENPGVQFHQQLPSDFMSLAKGFARFIMNNDNRRARVLKYASKSRLTPKMVRRLISTAMRRPCKFLQDFTDDFLDYYDTIYPPEEREGEEVPVIQENKFYLAQGRLCRVLFMSQELHQHITNHLKIMMNIPIDPADRSLTYVRVDRRPGEPANSPDLAEGSNPVASSGEDFDIKVKETEEFDEFDDDDEEPEDPEYLEAIKKISDKYDPRRNPIYTFSDDIEIRDPDLMTHWHPIREGYKMAYKDRRLLETILDPKSDLSSIMYCLILIGRRFIGNKVVFHGISKDDIQNLYKLRKMRLINCSPEKISARRKMADDLTVTYFKYKNIPRFITRWAINRQNRICLDFFETILSMNVDEVGLKANLMMSPIVREIRAKYPEELSFLETKGRYAPGFEDAIRSLALQIVEPELSAQSLDRSVIANRVLAKTSENCNIIREAVEDLIEYYDYVLSDEISGVTDVNDRVKLWILYGRICRALTSN